MIALTGYNLPDYLLNRGLLTYDDLSNDKWQFIENRFLQARNTNFIIQRSDGQSNYFLKQPVSIYLTEDGLQTEEDVLLELQKVDELKPHILKFVIGKRGPVAYDNVNRVLLLNYQESRSIGDILDGLTNIPRRDFENQLAVTKNLGETLAKFRAYLPKEAISVPDLKLFKPWLIELGERDIDQMLSSNSPFVEKLGNLLHNNTDIGTIRQTLNNKWEPTHLINSDSKLSNVLVVTENSEINIKDLKLLLIDWELTGHGPPLWQLAGIIADFLSFIVFENPPISEEQVWKHVDVLFHHYFLEVHKLEKGFSNPREEQLVTLQYAGIILLQQYYHWAAAYLHSGHSAHPDKFLLGKDCLLHTNDVLNHKFPSLERLRK